MKRIIIHWTAGTGQPNNVDYQHYHFLVNEDGLTIEGKYKPQDNLNCQDGVYAQHTGGGNTGSIGIALCGMANYDGKNPNSTKYPIKPVQFEACMKKVAQLCDLYGIRISPDTVMTHYEFGQKHPKTTSFGKIDITYLPHQPLLKKNEVGDFIRNKVSWYFAHL